MKKPENHPNQEEIRTLFIIGGRGEVIYGMSASVPTLEFGLAQKPASLTKQRQVPRMTGRNEFEMRLGDGDECEHQGA
jgi:hypothetical protein